MAHGAEDFYQYRPGSPTYPVGDLAELAVRLGALTSQDRRGEFVWGDSFEEGTAKWLVTFDSTDGSSTLTVARARFGGYALQIQPGTDAQPGAFMAHRAPEISSGVLGLEASMSWNGDITRTDLVLAVYTGTQQVRGALRYDQSASDLFYESGDGTWTAISTNLPLQVGGNFFHVLKLVVDVDSQEYVRLLVDQAEYSLAGTGAVVLSDSTNPYTNPNLEIHGSAAANGVFTIDAVILTQNEPA